MFFSQFMAWLGVQLQAYIATEAARAASALAPVATTLAVLYVMAWGYLQLSGSITEPLHDGVRRIVTLAVVLGGSLHLWLYNDVLVGLVVQGPRDLAAALLGAPDPVSLIDTIWADGGACADTLWNRGGVFGGDIGFYLAGAAVWMIVGLLCLYCAFLLALSQIAAAVLLAVGPLFLLAYLFERTRGLFESWLNQLINYGLIGLLVAMVAALLLQLIASYAQQTAALGSAITTVDVLDLLLASGIAFLLLCQVMPIAAGLSRGVSLSTLGSFGSAARTARATGTAIYERAFWSGDVASPLDTTPPREPDFREPDRYVTPVWIGKDH